MFSIFAVASLLCAVFVISSPARDLVLAGLSVPLFLSASIIGMIRSGRFDRQE